MQHPAAFTEDTALEKFPLEERIVVVLAQQSWASAGDIANRLDVSESDINKACDELEKNKKLIAGRDLGVTRRSQRRYVLTRQGVMHVTRPFQHRGLLRAALPLTWQMTEDGVTRMLLWLPMIESLYEILPTFWTSGLAAPFQWQTRYAEPSCSSHVWLGAPTLTEVRWLPSGRLHAIATWRFERHDKRPRLYSIPFFWAGLLPQEDYRSRSLRLGSRFIRCLHGPEDPIWWDIEPPVAAIALDQFAAFRSRTAYGGDVQVGAVDTAGALVWSAEASHSEWTPGDRPPQARSIGHPEAAAIGEGPDLVNLGGVREDRIFCFLSDFRAATKENMRKAFHMSGSSATAALNRLEGRGLLVTVEEKNLYVTQKGVDMLAARDRVDSDRLVEVTHLDPEGEAATRERHHDSAVAAVAAELKGAGMPVAAGWRWMVSWENGQLVPDIWALLPVPGREEGIWVPVEIEFSATAQRRIEEKYRSYRLAPVRLNQTFPILVITGEEKAAQRFDDQAGDLPVLTTTLKAFLTGVWEGPESVWRSKGRPVGLSEIAREHTAPHLRQPTGRSLDCSKPTPEVWERLIGEELIWSDPQTEDLDWEPPPMDLQLQAEDAKAEPEPAANKPVPAKPVSAPMPPTPPPAPVSTAPTSPDQARLQALSRIDWLVASADSLADIRLKHDDLTEEERICLRRVRAIITYGANRHFQAEERLVEQSLQSCLTLEDDHLRAIRSRNILWGLTVSRTKTDPRVAFEQLLKGSTTSSRDACRRFNNWSNMAERAARQARTLESGAPDGSSAT